MARADSSLAEVRLSATAGYAAGALVTLHSFLTHNPWFDGKIAVYCPVGDEPTLRNILAGLPGLEFRSISSLLLDAIAATLSHGKWVVPRLFALDMLKDRAEGAVLILDADLLFMASVQDLGGMPADLVASSEGAFYRGFQVDRTTNALLPPGTEPDLIGRTFNSGLMWLNAGMLGSHTFEAALAVMQHRDFLKQLRPQHDQYILNRIFENRWHDAGPRYNYLLGHADAIHGASHQRVSEAKVIHFNIEPRPWMISDVCAINNIRQGQACAWWLRALAGAMEQLPLRRTMQGR